MSPLPDHPSCVSPSPPPPPVPETLTLPPLVPSWKVSVVQHGVSGFHKHPRGLLLENFLEHADPTSAELNGPPKVRALRAEL